MLKGVFMNQITLINLVKLILVNTLIILSLASCSKAPKGVRAQVKNQQNMLNPTTSTQATQQAAAASVNYTISTISFPNQTDTGYSVDVEIQMPTGELLPLTTRHESNNNFSQGVYNDARSGLQVDIQASCSYDSCSKYLLLVTVYRNNQAQFQTFAISYSNDCKFNVASTTAYTGGFYNSLTMAENDHLNVGPLNDINSCGF